MKKGPFLPKLKKDLRRNRGAYLMFLPVLVYYLIFCYKPMYGVIIAFKDFIPTKGILASPWAANHGLVHFISFFKSVYFGRLIRNTLVISITSLFVTFPLPIIFALLLNEVRSRHFKASYRPVPTCPISFPRSSSAAWSPSSSTRKASSHIFWCSLGSRRRDSPC